MKAPEKSMQTLKPNILNFFSVAQFFACHCRPVSVGAIWVSSDNTVATRDVNDVSSAVVHADALPFIESFQCEDGTIVHRDSADYYYHEHRQEIKLT